jgi:hypothetical protein
MQMMLRIDDLDKAEPDVERHRRRIIGDADRDLVELHRRSSGPSWRFLII